MSAWYTAKHIAVAVEQAVRETRAQVLEEERARVSRAIRAILLDAKCAEAVLELLPYLFDNAERAMADEVAR